jgi:hypothetical protein
MIKSAKKEALLATLKKMDTDHPEIGLLHEIQDFRDEKLIIIINDVLFVNIGVQKVIAHLIDYFTRVRLLSLVGCDGAAGDVDTGWLKNIKDQKLRSDIVDSLLLSGKLTGIEYCHVYCSTPFVLFGPEDKELYSRAGKLWEKITPLRNFLDKDKTESRIKEAMNNPKLAPLFTDFQEFIELDRRRAKAMANNQLRKMMEIGTETSAIICRGNLPKYIAEELSDQRISYAIIDPAKVAADDKNTYEKMFSEQNKNFDHYETM